MEQKTTTSSPHQKVEHEEGKENLVAEAGPKDSYDSSKYQDKNRGQDEDNDFHPGPPIL